MDDPCEEAAANFQGAGEALAAFMEEAEKANARPA